MTPHDKKPATTCFFLFLFCFAIPLTGKAEVSRVTLPTVCAEFAYNSHTATVVAIDNARSEVLAFAIGEKMGKEALPFATLKVGKSPCSICYKEFGKHHYFAIVCSQDSNMYLFEEKTESNKEEAFKLVSQIDLSHIGISSVFASLNPEDPNIYFCYGGGHHSYAGAITLNTMKSTPFILSDVMDGAISASGLVLYHRGPWSSSGMRAEMRANSMGDDHPQFSSLFRELRSVERFVPDPFDMYTAMGSELYLRDLKHKVRDLAVSPLTFFRTKPIIVGINAARDKSDTNVSNSQKVELMALSYNSFEPNGSTVALDYVLPNSPTPIPRSDPETSDFKKITYRYRLFADDVRDRVIFADGNQLFFAPLADFKIKDEPLFVATIPEKLQFVVGEEKEYKFSLPNSKTKLKIDGLPAGMILGETSLKWRPSFSDVGRFTVTAHLSLGELKSTRKIQVAVECPSFELPFSPTGFVIDETSQKGLIWDGAAKPEAPSSPAQTTRTTRPSTQLAVIDLKSGKVEVQRELSTRILSAMVHDGIAFLQVFTASTSRIEAIRLNDLQRVDGISTSSPIQQMTLVGKNLVLRTEDQALSVYDTKSFKLIRSFPRNPRIAFEGLLSRNPTQLVANGILWSSELKPELLLTSPVIPTMGKSPDFSYVQFASLLERRHRAVNSNNNQDAKLKGTIVTLDLMHGKKRLQVHFSNHFEKVPNSISPGFYETKIYLTFEETDMTTVMLKSTRKLGSNFEKDTIPHAIAAATQNEAFIITDRELFRWGFPKQEEVVSSPSQPMRWNEKPTTLALGLTGKTELTHEVDGGKPPYSFSIGVKFDGLAIDEKSGVLTVDNLKVQEEAERFLIEYFAKHTGRETRVSVLRKLASQLLEPTSEILGRRPTGFPVAFPIQLKVTDDNLEVLDLNYFVITELDSAKLIAAVEKLDRSTLPSIVPQQPSTQPARGGQNSAQIATQEDVEKLNKRVDNLEQRMDTLTKQLSEVLKKLESPIK